MSNKVSLKNPKNQNFEVYEQKVFNLLEKAAKKMFKDKTFHEEFKAVFAFSTILKITSSLVSFFTGFIAIQIATKLLFGVYLSAFFAFSVCLCLEAVKAFFWRINSKWILRYKKVSKAMFGVLICLHLVSLGLSAYGGWILPKLVTLDEPQSIAAPNLDSIKAPFVLAISKLEAQTARNSQKVAAISSHSTIKSLNSIAKLLLIQRQEQEAFKNRAILAANAKYREEVAKSAEDYKKTEIKHNERIFVARWSCLFASVFFELLFVICSVFGVYYLFRLNVEIEARENAETMEEEPPFRRQEENAETSPKQAIDIDVLPSKRQNKRIGNPIGFVTKVLEPKKCHLIGCNSTFDSKVHNKKYCSDECKKMAYQKRRYSKTKQN